MTSTPPPNGDAPMGGSAGGHSPFLNQSGSVMSNDFGQQQPQPPYPQQQQQPPGGVSSNASYGNAPSTPEHRLGSVTQYASPDHMGGSIVQQQPQQPQQPQNMQQPGMGMQGSWQQSSSPGYASMSGQPQQQYGQGGGSMMQQQQQPQSMQYPQANWQSQQPQMIQPNYQQQSNFRGQQMPSQSQQPVPPGPQYRNHPSTASVGSQHQKAPPPAGSFAARSAQAYARVPQQQQQPQMQTTGMMQQPQYQQQKQQQPQQMPGSMQGSMMQQPGQQPQFQGQQYQQQMHGSMMQQPQFQQPPQQQQMQQSQYPPQQPGSHFPPPQGQPQPQNNMGFPPSNQSVVTGPGPPTTPSKPQPSWAESPAQVAMQNRLLTDATRKVQEHAYYMRQAMEKNDLPTVLDRASLMVGQLGENHAPSHHQHSQAGHPGHQGAPPPGGEASQLNPKNYYELHMRALEDMPHFEEYLLQISGYSQQNQPVDPSRITITMAPTPGPGEAKFTMRELYDCVQYCPQVLPRLYLQICAGSALIQSGEVGTKWVMDDLMQATKCVQNPVRGLFLRHYLLQMIRDKLPDSPVESTPLAGDAASAPTDNASAVSGDAGGASTGHETQQESQSVNPEQENGTVVDSYKFILANFIEMNKLWVRIQHLPGDGKSKDQRKRRERERNELRVLVGTNLVRLSQLEGVTSKIYGEVILPTVLDHIVVCGDPLAQAYLIDCITQVFPDEYHIETLPILLRVCPKLRDKVNIRTILQSLMDRLANYLADEELLDETDTNQVKKNMAQDSFPMFEDCVQNVYNARGPKLTAKEVVRLQTALLSFSLRCFHGDMGQVNRCLQGCVSALRQASASYETQEGTMTESGGMKPLDDVAIVELEKLLSIPLDSLALKVLQLDNYGELIAFLPWRNRREVALKLLKAVDNAGAPPKSVKEIQELFGMVEPVIRDEFEAPATSQYGNADDASVAMSQLSMSGVSAYGQPNMGFHQPPAPATTKEVQNENALVSKLVHLLDHEDTDVVYEMLVVARQHINAGGRNRVGQTLVAVVFAAFRLTQRVFDSEHGITDDKAERETGIEVDAKKSPTEQADEAKSAEKVKEKGSEENTEEDVGEETAAEGTDVDASKASEEDKEGQEKTEDEPESTTPKAGELKDDKPNEGQAIITPVSSVAKTVTCRKLFVFIQQTIAMLATSNVEMGFKLYLQAALTADRFAGPRKEKSELLDIYGPMPYELLSQAFALYEQHITDSKMQQRCVVCTMGTLLECRSLSDDDYQGLVTKTAQFSAKMLRKPDQCQLVAQCSHLFYPAEHPDLTYRNEKRALECLQRSLKLADACTSSNPEEIYLFVDLLDHYVHFFEKKCPVITHAYVTGLVALIKEHINNAGGSMGNPSPVLRDAKEQYLDIVRHIKKKKEEPETAEHFAPVNVD